VNILPLVGALLLLGLLADVLLTVLPPMGHGGPIHRRQTWLLWALIRTCTRRLRAPWRARVAELAGPILTSATVAVWAAWLITGFAIVYAGLPGAFADGRFGVLPGWGDAFYFSGYVATTLGLGDLIPATPVLRAVAVLEAVAGFALFAVATTYVLAISRSISRLQELSLELATARRLVEGGSSLASGNAVVRGAWPGVWARGFLAAAIAHQQYPLVHFFRPRDPDRDLVLQVDWLLRWSADIRAELEPAIDASDPNFELLFGAISRYLAEVNRACIPGSFAPLGVPVAEARLGAMYARLLDYLGLEAGPR